MRSCDNSYVGISRMTPDYLNTTGIISTSVIFEGGCSRPNFPPTPFKLANLLAGMAFFRLPNGTYYIVTSHLTGWSPNPLMLFRAANKTLDYPDWQVRAYLLLFYVVRVKTCHFWSLYHPLSSFVMSLGHG